MFSPKEENQAVLPCSQPQRYVRVGWRWPSLQTTSQGLGGDKPTHRQPHPEGAEAHNYSEGKPRGKGRPTSPLWSPGSKSNPKAKRQESLRPFPQLLTKSLILASI